MSTVAQNECLLHVFMSMVRWKRSASPRRSHGTQKGGGPPKGRLSDDANLQGNSKEIPNQAFGIRKFPYQPLGCPRPGDLLVSLLMPVKWEFPPLQIQDACAKT